MHGFWFKKFTFIHDRLGLEMNRYLQGAHVPEWMTKGKTLLAHKDALKEPPQTSTDILVPGDDMENINGTNKRRDL